MPWVTYAKLRTARIQSGLLDRSSRSLLSTVLQDKVLREKAEEELHETAESRGEESRNLISWIEKEEDKVPKITDSCYLWSFLRSSKFNQDATRQRMRNYWYSRRKAIMQVMNGIDPASPDILNILRGPHAVYIPLPGYDKDGRKVILARWDQLDVSGTTYDFNDWFRAITLVFDAMCFLDERVMVNGITFLMDAKGVAMKHLMFFGFNNSRKQFEVMQNGYPIRIKQVHYINNNRVIAFFLGVVKSVVSTKLANRIQLHGYHYDSVFDYIDKSSLPDEYIAGNYSGERAGTSQEIMERFIRENILEPTKLDFLRRLYNYNGFHEDSDTGSSEDDFSDAVIDDSDHFYEDANTDDDSESSMINERDIVTNAAEKEE